MSRRPDARALHAEGVALAAAGDNRAAAAIARAARAAPGDPNIFSDLGVIYRRLGMVPRAIAAYRRAVAVAPGHAGAWFNLGNALRDSGKGDDAVVAYRRAIAADPTSVTAYANLGLALIDLGRADDAIDVLERGLLVDPGHADIHNNLGNALRARGEAEPAAAAYRRATRVQPDYARAHVNLGITLRELGRTDEAFESYAHALKIDPDWPEAHNSLGVGMREQGRAKEAIASYRRALESNPDYAEALGNLGVALVDLGDLEEALAAFDRAVSLAPESALFHWNRALALLSAGRLREGWPEFEWRWRKADFTSPKRDFSQPQWDGTPRPSATILLHAEQGVGDTLHFIRYVPKVAARIGRVIVECQPELHALVAPMPGIERVVASGEPLPAFDVHAPLLSLPGIFATDVETLPADVPYIRPLPGRSVSVDGDGFKVGIAWAGSATHRNDHNRSVELQLFKALIDTPGCRFYSLQVGDGREQIQDAGFSDEIVDLGGQFDDFADTAAAVAELDLVISVDTAVVHLAGAMARPVWTLLPFAPDWRWLRDRNDSPWYPTMRLFRQKKAGEWKGVFRALGRALKSQAAPPRKRTALKRKKKGA